jgi:transposase-like protein
MALIEDFDRKTLHRFIEDNIKVGSIVCTDGLNSYRELNGYIHNRKVQNLRQGGEPLLPRVHLVISLLKRWLLGTLQGSASDKYLDDYLNEFVFRFNRRRSAPRGKLFYRLTQQAINAEPGDILEAHKPEDLVPGGLKCIPRTDPFGGHLKLAA